MTTARRPRAGSRPKSRFSSWRSALPWRRSVRPLAGLLALGPYRAAVNEEVLDAGGAAGRRGGASRKLRASKMLKSASGPRDDGAARLGRNAPPTARSGPLRLSAQPRGPHWRYCGNAYAFAVLIRTIARLRVRDARATVWGRALGALAKLVQIPSGPLSPREAWE